MIQSTCGYLIRGGMWLMLYRNRKKDDVNAGKWIGVGGKLLKGETPEECMIRETLEETGLTVTDPKLCGTVWFVYDERETEKIWVYRCERFSGELRECTEGTLAWIPEETIPDLPLWEGDRLFLNRLREDTIQPFELMLYYDNQGNLLKAVEKEDENHD